MVADGIEGDMKQHSKQKSMSNKDYNDKVIQCITKYYEDLLKVGYRDKAHDQCEEYKKFIKNNAKSLICMKILYHKFISDFDTGDILYACIVDKGE